MQVSRAKLWLGVKVVLAIVIVGAVAWHFAKILSGPELWARPLRLDPVSLALAMAAHGLALLCWATFWHRLLRVCGEKVAFRASAFAYFASQFGKYVPGKALAIVLRVAFARAARVRTGVAAMTAIYETLTSMAAGALVAAVLLPLVKADDVELGWKALGLLTLAGVPILPGVFHWLANRAAKPFVPKDAPPLPRLGIVILASGIVQTAIGWFFLGASLVAVLWSMRPHDIEISPSFWLTCTAYVAVSYVAGFIALPTPGGLGVREVLLKGLLARELAGRLGEDAAVTAVIAVLVLRLLWTVSEVLLAALFTLAYRAKSHV